MCTLDFFDFNTSILVLNAKAKMKMHPFLFNWIKNEMFLLSLSVWECELRTEKYVHKGILSSFNFIGII
jgi:hypothetical protein